MDATQALGDARRQHNAIVNGMMHGSGELEEALEGLQAVRAALNGLGDDAAQLASLAALNQAVVQYYLSDWQGCEQSLEAAEVLESRAHVTQRDFLRTEVRLARKLAVLAPRASGGGAPLAAPDSGVRPEVMLQSARQTLEEAEPGSVLSFESLLGAIKEQDQTAADVLEMQQSALVAKDLTGQPGLAQHLIQKEPSRKPSISIARGSTALRGSRLHTASLLFQEALDAAGGSGAEDGRAQTTYLPVLCAAASERDARSCALYGQGLACAERGDWRAASGLFAESVRPNPVVGIGQLPFVWLRLAECAAASCAGSGESPVAFLRRGSEPTSHDSPTIPERQLRDLLGRQGDPDLSLAAAKAYAQRARALLADLPPEILVRGAVRVMEDARRHLDALWAWIAARERAD